jgi:hypothetical protein
MRPSVAVHLRRRHLIAAGAVLLAGVAAGITALVWPGTSPTFGRAPRSYVVLYRNVINGVTQWEVLAVQRPLTGSDLTYRILARPAADAVPDAGSISTATALYTETADGVRLVSGRQPGPVSNDLWLTVELRDALARGVAVDLHQSRQVAGMRCPVYRLADPPSGPLHRLDMSVGHDDMCLGANGLVLSETWTYHGSVVEQRTAVTVAVGSWPTGIPQPSSTASAAPGSAAAATVTPDAHPTSFLATPPAPAGFRPAMTPVDFSLPDSRHPTQTVASTVVWSFVRGARVMTVEAGRERGGVLPWSAADSPTRPVKLRGLGAASTALRSDGPEVRVDLGDGRWVRVRGTVPLTALLSYAGSLRLG